MHFFTKYNERALDNFKAVFEQHKVVHVTTGLLDIDPDSFFKELAAKAGLPLIYEEDPATGQINVNEWTEIKYEPENASNTYKSSNKFQPLHTDYGYFSFEIYAAFFYCVTQAEFGGATTFIDVDTIVGILKDVDQRLFNKIQKHKITFGRKGNPIAYNEDFILQKDPIGWKLNWNYYRASGDKVNQGLIEDLKGFIDHYIEKSGELKEIKLSPGEGVFFQDRRVLHGRNSFIGDRHLNKGGIALEVPKEIQQILQRL